MDATNLSPTDPVALLSQLDADAIRQKLGAIDRERKALLVLLRAAIRARSSPPAKPQEDRHAD
jgi:hypothetical protein